MPLLTKMMIAPHPALTPMLNGGHSPGLASHRVAATHRRFARR